LFKETDGTGVTVSQKCFEIKAQPECDLRYFSKAMAFSRE